MSDIYGSDGPGPVRRVTHVGEQPRERPQGTGHSPRQSNVNSGGDDNTKTARGHETPGARDPAVSIAASTAHVTVGDRLARPVDRLDTEGRPLIVTETATFALKPDAGLRAGDDVILEIREADRTIAADLLTRNGQPVDPPVRLNLIVIALHDTGHSYANAVTLPPSPLPDPAMPVNALPPNTPLAPPSGETLAHTLSHAESTGTDDPALALRPTAPSQPVPGHGVSLADTPHDPTVPVSSQDLSTLIAAREQDPAVGTQPDIQRAYATSTAQRPVGALGETVQAFTANGQTVRVTAIDPAVTAYPPQALTEGLSLTPLSLSETKQLPLPLMALETAQTGYARLETPRGVLMLPTTAASAMVGQALLIDPPDGLPKSHRPSGPTPAATQPAPAARQETAAPLPHYSASLTRPDGSGQRVDIAFPPPGHHDDGTVAKPAGLIHEDIVSGMHTLRAFLSGTGPKSDVEIETSHGRLTLTLPGTVRPAQGDPIQIILPAAATTTQFAVAPSAALTETVAAVTTPAASPATLPTGPGLASLGEGYEALAGLSPAAQDTLTARTASGGGRLVNSLLFLLAAMGRAPDTWIGTAPAQALAGRADGLLARLREDVRTLLSRGGEPVGDWQRWLLPFDLRDGQAPLLALLVRHEPPADTQDNADKDNDGDDEPPSKHFILQVDFSEFGPVQLDGRIARDRDRPRFDLTLISRTDLPTALMDDLKPLFHDAVSAAGHDGALTFRTGAAFDIDAFHGLDAAPPLQ